MYSSYTLYISGQCELLANSLAAYPSATGARISWRCYETSGTSQFIITYTLTNKDSCNHAPDSSLFQPQKKECTQCNRADTQQSNIYSFFEDLDGLYAYSFYTFSVQPKAGNIYGSGLSGPYFVTNQDGE